jgi:leucyl/phenylalanyl-tRNA--protein transferase
MTELTSELLLKAYAYGVFPMAKSRADRTVFWVQPKLRGVLPLDTFHVPRSLKKTIRKGLFTVTVDQAFEEVMEGCAETTPSRPDTWINEQIVRLFTELHHAGVAHSVEVWRDGKLAGGLYGLAMGSAFFGESMFSRATDASKIALVHLVAILIRGGFTLLDTQFITEHLARFGTIEISQKEYLGQLASALAQSAAWGPALSQREVEDFLPGSQASTQTS